jgi:hypothetical protein
MGQDTRSFGCHYITTCHPPPSSPPPSRTALHGYTATLTNNFGIWGLTTYFAGHGGIFYEGLLFIISVSFTHSTLFEIPNICLHAHAWTSIACLLFIPP